MRRWPDHFQKKSGYWRDYADRASPVPLTSFSADVYTEKDLLGIDRTVDALALLIASTRTDTPLSIGVFGPWGAGKSFFMRHLRKRIWSLAGRERNRVQDWVKKRESGKAKPEDAPLYYGHVAQVDFNAWHYNEGNLVASLVDHMFRNLHVLPGKNDLELEKRRSEVLTQITAAEGDALIAKVTLEQTQQKVETARSDVKRATEELSSAQKDVAEKAKALAESTSQAEEARQEMETTIKELVLSTGTNADAVVAMALSPLSDSPALEGVRKAAAEWTRAVKDWRKFLSSLLSPRGAIVLALCLVAPLVGRLTGWLNDKWAALAGGAATGVAASVTSVIGFIRERRKEFEAKMEELKKEEGKRLEKRKKDLETQRGEIQSNWDKKLAVLQKGLEEQRTSIARREEAVRSAVQVLTNLNREFDQKVEARVSAEEELRRLQAKLKKLSSALLLDEFLKDRSGTEDYRKELGFLALVRRDFERLSDLIAAANDEWCSPTSKAPAPLLNRIVLYIDDLDRCKVETVIKVLEAVHLLLAFPLFVCVVAVDPRWIEQCLRKKNSYLFREQNNGDTMHVTVGDYLEKIFQIPIWMQPMECRQRSSLVKTLLGTTAAPTAKGARPQPSSDQQEEPSPGNGVERGSQTDGFQALVKRAEDTPDPLSISREESEFVDRLAPLLSDKPRALKRFVNSYRLLKASLSDIDRQTFVSNVPASPYKICMSQLAFFTGQPRLAPMLVQQVKRTDRADITLRAWAGGLDGLHRKELQPILSLFDEDDAEAVMLEDFRAWLPDTTMYLFSRDT